MAFSAPLLRFLSPSALPVSWFHTTLPHPCQLRLVTPFYTSLASPIPVSVVQDCVKRAHHKEVPG